MMLLTVNGQIVDSPNGALSALDRGFLFGDGVFDTLRIYAGKPFGLQDHLTRLADACTRTGIGLSSELEDVVGSEVERAGKKGLREAFMRITVSRGSGLGMGTDFEASTLVTLIDKLPKLDPRWYSDGITVAVAEGRRNEFASTAGIKTTAYLESIIAFRRALENGTDDALFLDTEGHLSEATASNLFIVRDGALHTPPLECGALPGITRATVRKMAESLGVSVVETRPLEFMELQTADEMFLTSSVREIVPVVSCDGLRIGGGKPGPVTRRVVAAYSGMTS